MNVPVALRVVEQVRTLLNKLRSRETQKFLENNDDDDDDNNNNNNNTEG